jgi:putative Holliday junction resolvase
MNYSYPLLVKMMKILGLDIGDVWTGTALSDALGITARPHKTAETNKLVQFLTDLFKQENINTIVVGYPKTMKGTESDQTKKVVAAKEMLEKKFPEKTWILWDERLSSQRASSLKQARTKEEKIQSHSVAAAFILGSYLDYLAFHRPQE